MEPTLSRALEHPGTFDAEAYLERLGVEAPQDSSLAALSTLLDAHMRAIPFENLDVLLGRTPRLDLASLQDKLVKRRRGGYCFEHAALMGAALRRFGFVVRDQLARVVMERPRERAGRTHHFLLVSLPSGPVVVDPGFGGLAPQLPLPLVDGHRVRAGGVVHRMRQQGPLWTLQAELPGEPEPRALWTSALDEALPPDFEMGNHFTATHPESHFRQRLALRALTPTGRLSVVGREVTLREGRVVQHWTLRHRPALRALLQRHFGFDLPEVLTMRVPSVPAWD